MSIKCKKMTGRKRKFKPAHSARPRDILTDLSKEPYITFSVRTTSPTTVCRHSSGTLVADGKLSDKLR